MTFTNKIAAIKFLIELFRTAKPTVSGLGLQDGTISLQIEGFAIGLKDAKDFVEACMALVPQQKPIECFYELRRVSALGGKVIVPDQHIGFYPSYGEASDVRNSIMKLRAYNEVWENEDDYLILTKYFSGRAA